MNSRGPSEKVHFKRNFTISVAICMGVIMLGDLKLVHIKQVVRFNLVRYNEVPLYANVYAGGSRKQSALQYRFM